MQPAKDGAARAPAASNTGKIAPQLLSLWNKELERLHRTLTAKELNDSERGWVKAQIEKLHSRIFD